jgi:hypothetical protein
MKAPLTGGPPTGLCTAEGAPVFAVVADDANVYFTSYSAVYEVPRSGGIPTALAWNQGSPNALAVDATRLYWTDGTSWPPPPGGGGGQLVALSPK